MQPVPTPAEIALDPARLLGGLPAGDLAAASSTMVGVKQLPDKPPVEELPPQV